MCCRLPQNNNEDEAIKTYGNHIINLAYHHDQIYGVDLTNHCTFIPIKEYSLKSLTDNIILPYVPNGDVIFKLTTTLSAPNDLFKDIDIIKQMLNDGCKQKNISLNDYKKLFAKLMNLLLKRKIYCKVLLHKMKN